MTRTPAMRTPEEVAREQLTQAIEKELERHGVEIPIYSQLDCACEFKVVIPQKGMWSSDDQYRAHIAAAITALVIEPGGLGVLRKISPMAGERKQQEGGRQCLQTIR